MDDAVLGGGTYALSPRLPLLKAKAQDAVAAVTSTWGYKGPTRVLFARDDSTTCTTDANLCQKPVNANSLTIPITLGVW